MFNNPILEKLASKPTSFQTPKVIDRGEVAKTALKVAAVVVIAIALIAAFKISVPIGCAVMLVLMLGMIALMLTRYLQHLLDERERKKSDMHIELQQRAPVIHYETAKISASQRSENERSLDSETFAELKSNSD